MTITLPDLQNLQASALSEFEQQSANIPAADVNQFPRAVARLEGECAAIYRFAVLTQRRDPNMTSAFDTWDAMVRICDAFLSKVDQLQQRHPGAVASRDKLLDLRLAAEKRRDLHRPPGTPSRP